MNTWPCRTTLRRLATIESDAMTAGAFGAPQARADVGARQALGVSIYTRFSAAVHVRNAPSFSQLEPASVEVALALLSIATDTLSWQLTDNVAFGLLHILFASELVKWPAACHAENLTNAPVVGRLRRLSRMIAAELRSECDDWSSEYAECAGDGLAEHPTRTRRRVCLRCRCRLAACGPAPLCVKCFRQSAHELKRLLTSCSDDLRDWRLLEAHDEHAPDGARFDFLNEFGRHALSADDAAWSSPAYLRQLQLSASGRASVSANPRAGPLEPAMFAPHLPTIFGSDTYVLRSVVGSGTEAVRSFWDVAEAFAPTSPPTDDAPLAAGAQLLILRGAYVGGAGPQQAVSGLAFVRDRALASTAARRLDDFLVTAPYRRLDVSTAIAEFDESWRAANGNRLLEDSVVDGALDDDEVLCLAKLDERLASLRARGANIGGLLVEFVRAHDGAALTPAYAHALARWARVNRLLLFDDSVLLGLRCGAPFASALYGVPCHWIAIGKLYGFAGVVQNMAADHHGGYGADTSLLNGYITCAISPLEVLRCRANLAAIATRALWRNAAHVGPRLVGRMRSSGLDCWGVGLAIWFDNAIGGVHNATTLHNRLLPPLTLTADDADEVVVRCGLFSHLPSLLNSALGRTRADEPPQWEAPAEVIRWHAEKIAADELQQAIHPRGAADSRPMAVTRRQVVWGGAPQAPQLAAATQYGSSHAMDGASATIACT